MALLANESWEGRVSIRKGMFAVMRYAKVTAQEIRIYKGKDTSAPLLFSINKENVKNITLPEVSMTDYFLKGYQGFNVEYVDKEENKTMKFWARNFGQHPHKEENQKLGVVLGDLLGRNMEELARADKTIAETVPIMMVTFLSVVAFGLLSGVVMFFVVSKAIKIYNDESLDKNKRFIQAVLYVVSGLIISTIITASLVLMRN